MNIPSLHSVVVLVYRVEPNLCAFHPTGVLVVVVVVVLGYTVELHSTQHLFICHVNSKPFSSTTFDSSLQLSIQVFHSVLTNQESYVSMAPLTTQWQ